MDLVWVVSLAVGAVLCGSWVAIRRAQARQVQGAGPAPARSAPLPVVELRRGVGGRRCPTCNAAVIEEDSVFCPRCGARLQLL